MLCKGCKTNQLTATQENFCISCQEKIQKSLFLAKNYFTQNDYSKGIEELNKVLEIDSNHQEAQGLKKETQEKLKTIKELKLQADQCIKEERYKDAAVYLNELIKLVPSDWDVQLQKQMLDLVSLTKPRRYVQEQRQRFRPADFVGTNYNVTYSTKIFAVTLAIIIGAGVLVNYFYGQLKHGPANELYQRLHAQFLRGEYYSEAFLHNYRRLVREHGETQFAEKFRQEISPIIPWLIRNYIKRGKELFDNSFFNESINEYSKVFILDPHNQEAPVLIKEAKDRLALAALDASLPSKITFDTYYFLFSEISQGIPDSARGYFIRGDSFFNKEENFKAIIEWKKAQGLVPQEYKEKIEILINHVKNQQIKALKEYADLIEKAEIFFKEANWSDAQDLFERAQKINPTDSFVEERLLEIKYILAPPSAPERVSFRYGFIYLLRYYLNFHRQEMKNSRFKDNYRRALLADGSYELRKANYYYKKANLYPELSPYINKQIKINNFILMLEKRLRTNPRDYNAKLSLGCAYYVKGWLGKAKNMWDSLKSEPANPGIYFLTNVLQAKITEKKEHFSVAQDYYEELLKRVKLFYVRNSLAKFLWQQGFVDEAVQNWEGILERYPDQMDVMIYLANAYVLLSKQEELSSLIKKFSEFNLMGVKKRQRYPPEIDPEYFVLLLSENDYFHWVALSLSQLFIDLGDFTKSLRWQQISMGLERKRK